MIDRRIVVTGVGVVTSIGLSVDTFWSNLISCKSGLSRITSFEPLSSDVLVAGEIKKLSADDLSNPFQIIEPRDIRKMGKYSVYGVCASHEAISDSGITCDNCDPTRIGVIIGSGIGGLEAIYDISSTITKNQNTRVTPFFLTSCLINMVSGYISVKYGFKGPNHSVVTACATGTHSIGDAMHIIKYGMADVMVAGGSEAAICKIGIAGFNAMMALSRNFNDTPTKASRPWDIDRDGFVMGEGSGVLILEEYEHAKKRGAKIYCEMIGYGMSGDANHITAPCKDGDGAYRAMKMATDRAGISLENIDYVNAHGTSTPLGDIAELMAYKKAFGENFKKPISSIKSSIGHLLGASGAVEAIASIKSLNTGIIPATLNLDNPDPFAKGINLVPNTPQEHNLNIVASNSFGFGGTNASIIFKKI